MRLLRRPWLLVTAALMGALVLALVLLLPTGCSDCAQGCPPNIVQIFASQNVDLPLIATGSEGPACPDFPLLCRGDDRTTRCTHVDVVAKAPGICDVTLVFADRPAMVVRTQFQNPPAGKCCRGYSVLGETLFIIPVASDGGITGSDGEPTDAVWIRTDGGADGSASDGGGTTDGGTTDAPGTVSDAATDGDAGP